MSHTPVENIVIVGTGCAGLTAAIYTGRANLNPLVIEGTLPGGQLTTTSEVENFPGFPTGIDGFQLMQNLREQAQRFGTRFEQAQVESVDFASRPFQLNCGDRTILARSVIIATGASPRLTGIPGEKELYGGKGVTTCATCDGAFYRNMEVAVIGGGDSAAEEALFLTRFASKVYLVHRRNALRASKIMADRVVAHPKIEAVWDSIPTAVQGVEAGSVSGLTVRHVTTGAERTLPVKGVFVAIGHQPNTGPFASALEVDANGYFVPASGSQVRTSVPGIYVAGDCADHIYRQAITAAGMGCQAAIEAERWLAEHHG
ncbi:thioredoxin-disulfide reductase [Opitutaceae bacterium TAV4]|uniref:thioredoxin-disulfide reductase n=1 Tax=Geminisphaera colitermitum TaxID=1148786 RepID=UPI000158CF84|nr:thioredoxin-disulfide reductase [Geminisphaera colitermitum]RRJ94577.1 thioredoxin-disulfide reductase [Opitutaceae bacterium TAV4]RRJ98640.1 thioredoxin-disulfide reductase [Opitutaceae bacterium TAV3]